MSTKLGTILADFTTALSTDIAVGGTTATLSSATDDDGVALPSGRYFFTLDGSNSSKEHISCDLVGTALTNIKSLSRQGVETTGAVRKHRIGTSVSLTDFGHIKFINDLIAGTTTLNASAPLGYDGAPASLTGNQLATVTYVLGVVNGGTVTFDQQIISNQTSGEALAINDIVYFKESDQRWYKADADLTTTFDQLQIGINKTTAGASGVTIQVAISGPVSGFTGLTAGSKYYLSNTAGAITTTAGTYSVFLGWALSTTSLLFNPVLKTLPTQKEKDALVGSTGIPSSTNKYVTQDNTSSATTDQTQLTQNGTVELGEANATTKKNKIAQSFIPTKTKIRGVNLYKSADTGTFTGTVTISIQADSAGAPSGTALATRTFTNEEWATKSVGEFETLFISEYASLVAGSLYWIVGETSTSDSSNHPNFGTNTAGGYSNGSVKYKNTTDGWTAIATIDLYFSTMEGNASQGVTTDTAGAIPLAFFDISKMPTPAFYQEFSMGASTQSTQTVVASGSNQTGTNIYMASYDGGNRKLLMFTRDTYTGQYINTYSISPTSSFLTGVYSAIVVLGSYIYLFFDNGTNLACYRYSATDLTGETVMTVPTLATPNSAYVTAWTDGVYFYVSEANTQSVVNKWSLSGTVLSIVGTSTSAVAIRGGNQSSLFDGTNIYILNSSADGFGTTILINKLTAVDGSTVSTTTKRIGKFGDAELSASGSGQPPVIAAPIDSKRMYIGLHSNLYNASVQMATIARLFPVTKP